MDKILQEIGFTSRSCKCYRFNFHKGSIETYNMVDSMNGKILTLLDYYAKKWTKNLENQTKFEVNSICQRQTRTR